MKNFKCTDKDSVLPHFNEVGGDNKGWNFITNLGKCQMNVMKGYVSMEELLKSVEKVNRTNFPHVLNPSTATFTDIGLHGLLRQRIGRGTVERRLNYLRFMEKHDVPVDLRNPTYENWLNHTDYREQYEFDNCKDGLGAGALKHEWGAMQMLLRAYGLPIWEFYLHGQMHLKLFQHNLI